MANRSSLPLPKAMYKKAIVILLSLFFIACGEKTAPHFKLSGETMGTTYHITVLEKQQVEFTAEELQQAVDKQLALINQQMSTYIDDSELSKLNRAPVAEPVVISPNLFDVLMLSIEVAWLSNGAFDITVAPLVDLWGFGPGEVNLNPTVPDEDTIARLLETTGFSHLELNLGDLSVSKKRDVHLDLSGIAKGFAVDKIAELLLYAGYTDFMVEIGGELRLAGVSPKGVPWKIAIEEPDAMQRSVHRAISLSDKAMATSGDYRNYFEQDGKRYSHTINPQTGYPIDHKLASVTVIGDSAAYADAMATAINVLGPEEGMKLAEQQDIAVYMIVKAGEGFSSLSSKAFEPFLQSANAN